MSTDEFKTQYFILIPIILGYKQYPENPTKTEMFCNDKITILIESNQLAQLRANLNSCIRLIQTSYDSIKSVGI